MISNLEKYKEDLEKLINQGGLLLLSMKEDCMSVEKIEEMTPDYKDCIKKSPNFHIKYQTWYSESLAIIKQLIPNRKDDFTKWYKNSQNRKLINHENYTIEDFLIGLHSDYATPKSALSKMKQQLAILKSAQQRFESSLFDIKQLLQADLFDSELDAATELNKKGFVRGAGAIAGVVLEGHLKQVCNNHTITITQEKPTINDLNDLLKNNNVIGVPDWRKIQYLADLRNLCDHKKQSEPTKEKVTELIEGVEKTIKTLF